MRSKAWCALCSRSLVLIWAKKNDVKVYSVGENSKFGGFFGAKNYFVVYNRDMPGRKVA